MCLTGINSTLHRTRKGHQASKLGHENLEKNLPRSPNGEGTYLVSASSNGPVETGLRYKTPLAGDFFLNALQRRVETIDLPTFVLAP